MIFLIYLPKHLLLNYVEKHFEAFDSKWKYEITNRKHFETLTCTNFERKKTLFFVLFIGTLRHQNN